MPLHLRLPKVVTLGLLQPINSGCVTAAPADIGFQTCSAIRVLAKVGTCNWTLCDGVASALDIYGGGADFSNYMALEANMCLASVEQLFIMYGSTPCLKCLRCDAPATTVATLLRSLSSAAQHSSLLLSATHHSHLLLSPAKPLRSLSSVSHLSRSLSSAMQLSRSLSSAAHHLRSLSSAAHHLRSLSSVAHHLRLPSSAAQLDVSPLLHQAVRLSYSILAVVQLSHSQSSVAQLLRSLCHQRCILHTC